MPKGFMLTAEAVQKIKADHESLRLRVRELEGKAARAQSQVAVENIIYVKVTQIVTGLAGGVLGSGKAIAQEFSRKDKTISDQTRRKSYGGTAENRELDIYNKELVPVPVDTVVRCFRDFKSGLWIVEAPQTAVGKAPNGISARSGTTAGSGQVDIYTIVSGVFTYSGYGLTAYNIADAAVAGGQHVMIKRNGCGENWFVDMAECE
jgi:hypothetical protein